MTHLQRGQIWRPVFNEMVASRVVTAVFVDATGVDWMRWTFQGDDNSGCAMPAKAFKAWIRRHQAKVVQ